MLCRFFAENLLTATHGLEITVTTGASSVLDTSLALAG